MRENTRRTPIQSRNQYGNGRFLLCKEAAARISDIAADRMEQAMRKTAQQTVARQLADSVDRLQKQAETVEFWATALTGFAQPVPDYDPEATAVARYVKPGRPPRKRRRRSGQRKEAGAKPASA